MISFALYEHEIRRSSANVLLHYCFGEGTMDVDFASVCTTANKIDVYASIWCSGQYLLSSLNRYSIVEASI